MRKGESRFFSLVQIGKQFERLTVISKPRLHNGQFHVKCRCKCGNEKRVRIYNLTKGHTRSCGCLYLKDVPIGQQFGKLTIEAEVRRDAHGVRRVRCRCTCGKTRLALLHQVTKGATKHCGCCGGAPTPIGARFERLEVIGECERNRSAQRRMRCRCDCGNVVEIAWPNLKRGKTKSRGCYARECHKLWRKNKEA